MVDEIIAKVPTARDTVEAVLHLALKAGDAPRVALRFATKHWPPPHPISVVELMGIDISDAASAEEGDEDMWLEELEPAAAAAEVETLARRHLDFLREASPPPDEWRRDRAPPTPMPPRPIPAPAFATATWFS